ncbi:hypothetical protein ACVIVD_008016 [Bradyrhizobium liaoningense]
MHGAEHVEPEILLPRRGIAALRHRAGIGEQQVDAAELLCSILDPGLQRRAVGDVDRAAGGLDAARLQLCDSGRNLIGVARAHRDIGAFTGQRRRNRPPDAARAAEDDGVLAFETEIHCWFSLCWSQ